MPNTHPYSLGSGFADRFFTPAPEAVGNAHRLGDAQEAATAQPLPAECISYRPDKYGSHEAFVRSDDFELYKAQFQGCLISLCQVAHANRVPAQEYQEIMDNFYKLYDHRFNTNFFSTTASIVDGAGMRSLHELCHLVKSPHIPDDTKCTVIRNVARGVTACADGAASNLAMAARSMATEAGGLCGLLWQQKEATIRAILQSEIQSTFGTTHNFAGMEIHYVNAAWDHFADSFGLDKVNDALGKHLIHLRRPNIEPASPMSFQMSTPFLNYCESLIAGRVSADLLTLQLAEQCQSQFNSALGLPLTDDPLQSYPYDAEAVLKIDEALRQVREKFDAALLPQSFINICEETYESYKINPDPTLVAVDLLHALNDKGLLSRQPDPMGTWHSADGKEHLSLFIYGNDLVWGVRHVQPEARSSLGPMAEKQLLSINDLDQWAHAQVEQTGSASGRRATASQMVPSTAWNQSLRVSSAQEFLNMQPDMADNISRIVKLFDKLGPSDARAYQKKNFNYFANQFSPALRPLFTDTVLGTGFQKDRLIRAWYPEPVDLLREPVDHRGTTRLHSLLFENRISALDAIGTQRGKERSLFSPGYITPNELYDSLLGKKGLSAVFIAIDRANIEPLAAWGRLLTVDGTAERLGTDNLYRLLSSQNKDGQPLLSYAIKSNCPKAVEELTKIISHPHVAPVLAPRMFDFLLSQSSPQQDGTQQTAMQVAIPQILSLRAYIDMMCHPVVVDCLTAPTSTQTDFGSLMDNQPSSEGIMDALLKYDMDDCFKTLCKFMLHPGIQPHMAKDLTWILNLPRDTDNVQNLGGTLQASSNPSSTPCPLISRCMLEGNVSGMKQAFEFMMSPQVLPHIQDKLPALFSAQNGQGGSVIIDMITQLDYRAIKPLEFFAKMLADPRVLPHVAKELPKILEAPTNAGEPGLCILMNQEKSSYVQHYLSFLTDSALTPHIKEHLADLFFVNDKVESITALEYGSYTHSGESVKAFANSLCHPAVMQSMGNRLIDFMTNDVRNGIKLALSCGRKHVLSSYASMLLSPQIHARLGHEVVTVLNPLPSERSSNHALHDCLDRGDSETLQKFIQILSHPDIRKHFTLADREVFKPSAETLRLLERVKSKGDMRMLFFYQKLQTVLSLELPDVKA